MNRNNVSIIIPTYNRVKILNKCLLSLKIQKTEEKFEVIVVDDGWGKDTKKVCDKYVFCHYVFQNNMGPAMARNTGIKKSKGEILILVNDDCIVNDDFIDKHCKFHQKYLDKNIALVGLFLTDKTIVKNEAMKWLEKSGMHFKENIKESLEKVGWHRFWTGNCSMKKSFIVENDLWFDKDFKTAAWEDIEFAYRANLVGMKLYRDSRIVGSHYHKFEFRDIFNRFYSHGRGLYQLSKKMPIRELPPLAKKEYRFMAKFILGVSLSFKTGPMLSKFVESKRVLGVDFLIYYLMIYWKIKGFDYESSLDISRN